MKIGIATRLFAAVLATAVLMVALVGGATRWNFTRGFLGYLNDIAVERMSFVLPRLEQAYAENGNWDFLREHPRAWFRLLGPGLGDERHRRGGDRASAQGDSRPLGPPPQVSDLTGAVVRLGLLDAQEQWVAGYRDLDEEVLRQPVLVAGQIVGWLVLVPFQSVADGGDQRFQQGQLRTSLATAALALGLALAVAWWVSRTFSKPLREVADATHKLAAGHHDIRVAVRRSDEVGQLAQDFNHLALTLERNEALRRDFIADVSHELRTPLSVLRGELEALEDGVRPFDAQALSSLQGEVRQLGKLVDDLYELALSDAGALSYQFAPMALDELVRRVADSHRMRAEAAGLSLELLIEPPAQGDYRVQGDEGRLQQLLDNLLQNSLRYTGAPGRIALSLRAAAEGGWLLEVQDSKPGVPAELLKQLFERFFRVDGSRSRAAGGAGLGLAICRNIVLAHGGTIVASPSALGGVRIAVQLPAA